jgi:hypothetical protein
MTPSAATISAARVSCCVAYPAQSSSPGFFQIDTCASLTERRDSAQTVTRTRMPIGALQIERRSPERVDALTLNRGRHHVAGICRSVSLPIGSDHLHHWFRRRGDAAALKRLHRRADRRPAFRILARESPASRRASQGRGEFEINRGKHSMNHSAGCAETGALAPIQ